MQTHVNKQLYRMALTLARSNGAYVSVAYAQVTHSRTGRRISHGYNPASFVAIRIGP